MKKLTLIVATLLTLGISAGSFAQQVQQAIVPHAFKYQAVARDGSGNIISNQNVSFRISIVQGSASGTTVYEETQSAATNQFGLANLAIGQGNVLSGAFADIQWGNATYFVKIEFDPKGGSNYSLVATSQMLSVPYALYSEHSETADNVSQQVALVATNVAQPLDNPATGLIVYNTATSGTAPYQVAPGLYYNAGTPQVANWVPVGDGSSAAERHHGPATSCSTNTTYGGTVQGNVQANCTSAPTGADNTGFGTSTFGVAANPTGADNTTVGYEGLTAITSGSNNDAIGSQALVANTKGGSNDAMGYEAMKSNTTASQNVAVGYQAMFSESYSNSNATWPSYDVAVGVQALYANSSTTTTNGYENTAIGDYSLYHNITGSHNSALGLNSLQGNTYGGQNTGVGNYADYLNTTGSYITAIGDSALYNNTGDSNTGLGYGALVTNTSGTGNTALGYGANVGSAGLRNATAIGVNSVVSTSNSLVLGGTGINGVYVGIGQPSPTALLDLKDPSSSNSKANCHIKSEGTAPAL
ncbi:MAG TPA: hypothetical protein VNZ45_08160, partial [Bacteroidia bacterium]|nr:hypothetical protein [Bacteroidia bacterium]